MPYPLSHGVGKGWIAASAFPAIAAVTGPLTTMPVATSLYRLDPDQISGTDGSRVTSYTDVASGLTATANAATPLGPVLKTGVYNGHRALRFASNASEQLSLGRPASLTAKTTGYTVVVVLAAVTGTGTYGAALSSDFNVSNSLAIGATTAGAGAGGNSATQGGLLPFNAYVGDSAANLQVVMFSGDVGAGTSGRHYRNGVVVGAGTRALLPGTLDLIIGNLKNSGSSGFNGPLGADVLWIEIFDRAFTPPEALQTHLFFCNKHGVASPLAGRTEFNVFAGDSQTYGTGGEGYPSQLAKKRGWSLGQWANVGVPSIAVQDTSGQGAGMLSRAAAEVDAYQDVVGSGIKVNVIMGEWHNQGTAGGVASGGVPLADNNRLYASQRKSAGKVLGKIIGWTSHDSTREGGQRDGFNQSLVDTPGSFDLMIPVHTNTSIGVNGTVTATPFPNATGSTDGVHMGTAGYAILRDLIDAGMISAGATT